jgi:hypothetical protein
MSDTAIKNALIKLKSTFGKIADDSDLQKEIFKNAIQDLNLNQIKLSQSLENANKQIQLLIDEKLEFKKIAEDIKSYKIDINDLREKLSASSNSHTKSGAMFGKQEISDEIKNAIELAKKEILLETRNIVEKYQNHTEKNIKTISLIKDTENAEEYQSIEKQMQKNQKITKINTDEIRKKLTIAMRSKQSKDQSTSEDIKQLVETPMELQSTENITNQFINHEPENTKTFIDLSKNNEPRIEPSIDLLQDIKNRVEAIKQPVVKFEQVETRPVTELEKTIIDIKLGAYKLPCFFDGENIFGVYDKQIARDVHISPKCNYLPKDNIEKTYHENIIVNGNNVNLSICRQCLSNLYGSSTIEKSISEFSSDFLSGEIKF